MVVSHLDQDHCGLIPYLDRRFHIGQVVCPTTGALTEFGARVRRFLRAAGLPFRTLAEGGELRGGELDCRVLHPDARFLSDATLPENEKSMVVRGEFGSFSFLLTGDVQSRAMRRLCRDYGDRLAADLLVLPHHGRYHEGLEGFIDNVRPAVVVVSGEADDCPPETAALLGARGIPLWITGREGAIIVDVGRDGVRLRGHVSGRMMEFEPRRAGGERGLDG